MNYPGVTLTNSAIFENCRDDVALIFRFSGNSGVTCDLGGFFLKSEWYRNHPKIGLDVDLKQF